MRFLGGGGRCWCCGRTAPLARGDGARSLCGSHTRRRSDRGLSRATQLPGERPSDAQTAVRHQFGKMRLILGTPPLQHLTTGVTERQCSESTSHVRPSIRAGATETRNTSVDMRRSPGAFPEGWGVADAPSRTLEFPSSQTAGKLLASTGDSASPAFESSAVLVMWTRPRGDGEGAHW